MIAGELALNWGCAEMLAFASLLKDGYSVRLIGQDSVRGTFAISVQYVVERESFGSVVKPI